MPPYEACLMKVAYRGDQARVQPKQNWLREWWPA